MRPGIGLRGFADDLLLREVREAACIPPPGPPQATQQEGSLSHRPWWIDFPINAQYFTQPGVIVTPGLGLTGTILSFVVPQGWDGVIRKISHNYTGPGFVQGSGDLIFQIRVAGAMVKTYANILVEFGSPQLPRETYILIHENQLVEYLVTTSAVAAIPIAGTFINAFMDGWEVPRR